MRPITPCLWFDTEAEEAATFYTSVFPGSRILEVTHYGPGGMRPEGMVLTVEFELEGNRFTALNGGPDFQFDEAISFQVDCEDQTEVDRFWEQLTAEGGQEGPCGWVKDRYGVSWQIIPRRLPELLKHPDRDVAERCMRAMLQMSKIDVAALEDAAAAPTA